MAFLIYQGEGEQSGGPGGWGNWGGGDPLAFMANLQPQARGDVGMHTVQCIHVHMHQHTHIKTLVSADRLLNGFQFTTGRVTVSSQQGELEGQRDRKKKQM